MPFLTPFEHCSSLSFSAHFPITEKWSCHAFFPPPHAWCTPPPALTSRIWLPPRTALVGPVPLPQGPTHGSGLQEEDWCGWGVPFKNTVFVATACVCVVYMHASTPSLYNVNFSSGPAIPSFTRSVERGVFGWYWVWSRDNNVPNLFLWTPWCCVLFVSLIRFSCFLNFYRQCGKKNKIRAAQDLRS